MLKIRKSESENMQIMYDKQCQIKYQINSEIKNMKIIDYTFTQKSKKNSAASQKPRKSVVNLF